MTDVHTHKPIRVSSDGIAGPYIVAPVDLLDQLCALLDANEIHYWVDHNAISVDGRPAVVVVNLRRGVDARHIQALLDASS